MENTPKLYPNASAGNFWHALRRKQETLTGLMFSGMINWLVLLAVENSLHFLLLYKYQLTAGH